MPTIIDLTDAASMGALEKEQRFKYVRSTFPELRAFERKFTLDHVSLLGNSKAYGVFVKDTDLVFDSKHKTCLGEYLGKRVAMSSVEASVATYDTDYLFELGENSAFALDAKKERNWTAFVNTASCASSANIYAEHQDGHIFYYLKQTIKQGEQLLIYYGDSYYQKDKGYALKFMNPNDGRDDSKTIVTKYRGSYAPQRKTLPADFLACFYSEINADDVFMAPKYGPITASTLVDLPYLTCGSNSKCLPQFYQENIRPLMLACWQGDEKLVRALLSQGANPMIQSSISGVSAMHLIVASPHSFLIKKTLIQLLLKNGAVLHLQDMQDKSILHWAIACHLDITHKLELVTFLMAISKQNHQDKDSTLVQCIDHKRQDCFIYAIVQQEPPLIRALLDCVRVKDIAFYLEEDITRSALSDYLNTGRDPGFMHVLLLIVNKHHAYKHKAQIKSALYALIENTTLFHTRSDNYAYYRKNTVVLDDAFCTLLNLSPKQRFLLPDSDKLCDEDRFQHEDHVPVDLPLLAVNAQKKPIATSRQEQVTLLMWACWQGNVTLVQTLLYHNSDPTKQSKHTNMTALHVLVASPIHVTIKHKLMSIILNNNPDVIALQNCDEETVLHWLVNSNEQSLIELLVAQYQKKVLSFEREASGIDSNRVSLLDYVDKSNLDALLYAMNTGKHPIVKILMQSLCFDDFQFYCDDLALKQHIIDYINLCHSAHARLALQFVRDLQSIIEDEPELSSQDVVSFHNLLDDVLKKTPLTLVKNRIEIRPAISTHGGSFFEVTESTRGVKRKRTAVQHDDYIYGI